MPYYKFNKEDVLYNSIETHPKQEFFIYNSSVYLNNQSKISGAFTGTVPCVPPGYVSLYEINVDRQGSNLVYPFVTRNGTSVGFRTISTSSYFETEPGSAITSSYPMSASITRQFYNISATRTSSANRISALKNTLNYYTPLSDNYAFTSDGYWSKGTQAINLISIPSIFYGSSIKKGSIDLKFYLTGTLIGHLKDDNYNGDLLQVGPRGSNGSGSVAGVVLYNEGFILLTGSWPLDLISGLDYTNEDKATRSSWLYYAVGANDKIPAETDTNLSRLSASYSMEFSGTNHVPTITMLAHAPRNELNYSSNPTYIDQSSAGAFIFYSSSAAYVENDKQTIKNTIESPYVSPTGSYKPQTFISKVGIFDENKNLIGIAKVATPVKKTEERELTFKLKLDF
tara:strand:- start:864 stop:2057 length:1194 start_codon:yes stop_codon:yes gene_type:complete